MDALHAASTAYREALRSAGYPPSTADRLLGMFLTAVQQQIATPHTFEPFHRRVTTPFDYYTFGVDFFRPLVDKARSTLHGHNHLAALSRQLAAGDNVIFLANHQSEGDPQMMSLMLEDDYPALAADIIFVAGERVTTDPLAVPFSMGRNLLCIYSKRHIDHPPELKTAKTHHNRRTMEQMAELLALGGHCIYVAPSGGRDRRGTSGEVEVARFDPQNVEMFYLMAQRAGHPTHFYPMAMDTYDVMPPPETIEVLVGEARRIKHRPVHLSVGPELDLDACASADRHQRRVLRADAAWRAVVAEYARFPNK